METLDDEELLKPKKHEETKKEISKQMKKHAKS